MSTILTVNSLSKSYGSHKVLDKLSFNLQAGELVVVRGVNGSGKTTLLHCISGLIPFDEGSITLAGQNTAGHSQALRRNLVFIPDVPQFYTELTAYEHLHFIAAANNALDGFTQRAEELLKRFGLWNSRDVFPHHYSRGMRLKLGLLLGFIRPAAVLLLDEPNSAIDSDGLACLIQELQARKAAGQAILLSSHDPQFAASVADTCYKLDQGILEHADHPAA